MKSKTGKKERPHPVFIIQKVTSNSRFTSSVKGGAGDDVLLLELPTTVSGLPPRGVPVALDVSRGPLYTASFFGPVASIGCGVVSVPPESCLSNLSKGDGLCVVSDAILFVCVHACVSKRFAPAPF